MPFSPKLIRIARRLLLGLAVFATLLACAYVIENWRGDRAWEKYAAAQAARGVDLMALPRPSTLPDGVNFLKTPVIDRWLFVQSGDKDLKAFIDAIQAPFDRATGASRLIGFTQGERFDHAKLIGLWNDYRKKHHEPEIALTPDPATQTLELLAPMDAVLAELRQAAKQRSETQLVRPAPIDRRHPFDAPIPPFRFVRELGWGLGLHACASLSAGQVDLAHDDVLAGLKLARGLTNGPDTLLVETMMGTVLAKFPLQALWEGLQQHAWRPEQLAEIQQELARADLFQSLDRALRVERAGFLNTVDQVPLVKFFQLTEPNTWLRLVPRGWIQQNKVVACDLAEASFAPLAARHTGGFLAALAKVDQVPAGFGSAVSPYMFIASMSVPAVRKLTENTARTQTFLTLAQTACALERHWLAHGKYPAGLAELVPAYLDRVPLDLVNGLPLHYRPAENGRFVLYSVGLDGKDDGGKPTGSKQPNDPPGDWAWPQAVGP